MKRTKKQIWFFVSLGSVLLAAPNATIIKYSLGSIDPFTFNVLRFLIIAAVTTPYLYSARHNFNKTNTQHAIVAGISMSVAVIAYTLAIKESQASYVSIITLLTPIFFVLYSVRLTGEKVTKRAIAGISLAAIGAFTIVFLPIALQQRSTFVFYPIATVLALLNTATYPISIINYKQANDKGLPLPALMCVSAIIIVVSNLLVMPFFEQNFTAVSNGAIIGILYSGIIVALVARVMHIASYEHIGSAITSVLQYLETFVAILLPVIILEERLSIEMVVGGILILLGVFVVEHHKSAHHKHHYIFRHH